MKITAHLLLAAATLVVASSAHADTITKAASGTNLAAAASWNGGVAPTSVDVATWADTSSLGGALTVGTAVNWGSISINEASANINITGSAITTGNITLAGTKTLTIGNAIALSGNSIFTIADVTASTAIDAAFNATISGAFGITKEGDGTLRLAGGHNYSGNTTVNAGTLEIAGTIYNSASTQTITVASGATLKITNAANNPLGHGQGQTWNIAGTLTEAATAGVQILAGTVNLNGGTLTASGAGHASYGSFVVLNGDATITANGTGNTISAANFGIGNGTTLALTLATTQSTDTLLVSSAFKNTGTTNSIGRIVKTGAGTVTFTGASTYSGGTTISAGTLLANNSSGSATGTGAVSVASGARLGGTGAVTGAVTVNGILRGGDGTAASGTLTIGGNVTLASGSVIELALGSGGTHSSLAFNGATDSFQTNQIFSFIDLGMTAGTYTGLITGAGSVVTDGWDFTAAGWQYDFTNNAGSINLTLTAVPEPSTYGLIGAGALAAVAMVRRRRKHAGKVA